MRLTSVTVQQFQNFVDPQTVDIERDVTVLVGKNESGKTTILKALHRLKPANGSDIKFDMTTEYPRWKLARDRRRNGSLDETVPIAAVFELDDTDRRTIGKILGTVPAAGTVINVSKNYKNTPMIWLQATNEHLIRAAAEECSLPQARVDDLIANGSKDPTQYAKSKATELKTGDDALAAKAFTQFATAFEKRRAALSLADDESRNAVWKLVPSFFYFSNYNLLPGECDLTELARKVDAKEQLPDPEQSVVALLAHAGEQPKDFLDANYDSRKAELQAASADLSNEVFKYWRQNPDLSVIFDTDNVVVNQPQAPNPPDTHRILKIELRDARHGGVETNFSTRSTGFQWFFSFFAAFSKYQDSERDVIVLLDEPGTSLHGDAQRDFVRYIFSELGQAQQTVYTTHSQHMIDPTKYEKLRAVDDRATREGPDQGVHVSLISLAADRATLLPIESAIGYSVSQHLFLGSGPHLAVEGSSDYVFLQRLSEHLGSLGKVTLDPHFSVIPVGGIDNMPAFVALLGKRLRVTALIDGARTSNKTARILAAAKHNDVAETNIVTCSEIPGVPTNADVEDLFDPADYLRLYNWAFSKSVKVTDLPTSGEPIIKKIEGIEGSYDHALPAHALTENRAEFFSSISADTVGHFEELFTKLNSTLLTGPH